jgi:NTP pyrophosphatase (non-canonical NTP hydrolase)
VNNQEKSDKNKDLGEELADVVFCGSMSACKPNRIDLQAAFDKKLDQNQSRSRLTDTKTTKKLK